MIYRRLLPTVLALITLLFMVFDRNNEFLKMATIGLCMATSIVYFSVYRFKWCGQNENSFFILSCGFIWAINAGIQTFLLTDLLSKLS